MRRFYSFSELIQDYDTRNSSSFVYAEETVEDNVEDSSLQELSYRDLAAMIRERADAVRAVGTAVDVVPVTNSVEAVVRIFGDVIAGCDVVMADPMIPEEVTAKVAAGARAARGMRLAADPDQASAEGEVLFFTSGTTSRSKVVRLTSRSLCASAWSGQSMLACGPEDRLLSILPLAHVFGFVCALLWGLAYGATVCLGRGVRHLIDDAEFFQPTIIPAVPSIMAALVRFDALNPECRVALIGAAPCTPAVTAALRARGIAVYLGYGLTETSSGVAITQDLDEPEAMYVCPGTEIRVEEDGEVSITSECMMAGYLGQPPVGPGYRFYTGDLGGFDDKGRLRLQGRKKDVLLMPDGTKIYCPEYEEDLARISGQTDLAVASRNGRAVLIAGQGSDPAALRQAVNEYNNSLMRSQQIYDIIIADGPLPRTVTGKLKRYELGELS